MLFHIFHKMEIPNIVMLTPEGNYPDGSWKRRERERKAKKQNK